MASIFSLRDVATVEGPRTMKVTVSLQCPGAPTVLMLNGRRQEEMEDVPEPVIVFKAKTAPVPHELTVHVSEEENSLTLQDTNGSFVLKDDLHMVYTSRNGKWYDSASSQYVPAGYATIGGAIGFSARTNSEPHYSTEYVFGEKGQVERLFVVLVEHGLVD